MQLYNYYLEYRGPSNRNNNNKRADIAARPSGMDDQHMTPAPPPRLGQPFFFFSSHSPASPCRLKRSPSSLSRTRSRARMSSSIPLSQFPPTDNLPALVFARRSRSSSSPTTPSPSSPVSSSRSPRVPKMHSLSLVAMAATTTRTSSRRLPRSVPPMVSRSCWSARMAFSVPPLPVTSSV